MIFPYYISILYILVGGLEQFFFHVLGIIIPTDFHIFQRGWNHQPAIISHYTNCFYFPTYPSEVSWSWHPQNWQDSLSGSSLSFVEELDNKEKATWRLVGAAGPKNSQVACEFDYGLWFMWMFIVYRTSSWAHGFCKQTISIWLGGAPPWMTSPWCQEEMIVCKWKSSEHCNNMYQCHWKKIGSDDTSMTQSCCAATCNSSTLESEPPMPPMAWSPELVVNCLRAGEGQSSGIRWFQWELNGI